LVALLLDRRCSSANVFRVFLALGAQRSKLFSDALRNSDKERQRHTEEASSKDNGKRERKREREREKTIEPHWKRATARS
jgi:hypothetical protein